jgi:alkanesulfonate monooxygenase SsuD/methylene tetrahydromethanopterin reductase-like flavin-dependent oxidoreductase (luciferase family)
VVRTGVLVGSWPLGMPADPVSFYARLPVLVEEAGFDHLFVGDHLFAAGPSVDALTVASAFATRTSTLTIGTGVLQLAMREPVATAKQIATIDCLSGGRFVLGVGAGGEFADEWAAVGVARETRGARLDEYIDVAAALWSGEQARYEGTFTRLDGVLGSPLPSRAGGPPVWIGGRSDAALARAARHDGWLAYAASTRRLRASLETLAALRTPERPPLRIGVVLFTYAAADAGIARERIARVLSQRYRQDFDRFVDAFCAIGGTDDQVARAEEYRAAGATDIFFSPQCPADEFLDQVDRLAEVHTALAARRHEVATA